MRATQTSRPGQGRFSTRGGRVGWRPAGFRAACSKARAARLSCDAGYSRKRRGRRRSHAGHVRQGLPASRSVPEGVALHHLADANRDKRGHSEEKHAKEFCAARASGKRGKELHAEAVRTVEEKYRTA